MNKHKLAFLALIIGPYIFFILFALLCLTRCSNAETYMQTSIVEDGKDSIRAKLNDPSSAEFRNVYYSQNVLPVACGEVNAKNMLGGYAGYRWFVANGSFALLQDNSTQFVKVWRKMCK